MFKFQVRNNRYNNFDQLNWENQNMGNNISEISKFYGVTTFKIYNC